MVNHATSVSARGISRETQDKKEKFKFLEEEEEEGDTDSLLSVRLPRNANATLSGSPPHKMMRPCTNPQPIVYATTTTSYYPIPTQLLRVI